MARETASGAPQVSVVIATRDRPELVLRAVRSCLKQEISDIEILVVDGSSDGRTRDAVCALDEPRVAHLAGSQSSAAAALNEGVAAARSGLIALLDDDDYWFPGKLQAQLEELDAKGEETGVVYTLARHVSETREWVSPDPSVLRCAGRIHELIFSRETHLALSSAVVRKSAWEAVGGFDEALPTTNDYDFWLRVSERYLMWLIPVTYVCVEHKGQTLSRNVGKTVEAAKMLLDKYQEKFDACPEVQAAFLARIGRGLRHMGMEAEAQGYLDRAVERLAELQRGEK